MFTNDHGLIACHSQKCRRMSRIVKGGLHELPTIFSISGFFDVLAIKESNTGAVEIVSRRVRSVATASTAMPSGAKPTV